MKNILIFILIAHALNCFGQQYSKKWEDLDYAGDGMIFHLLDIYLPEKEANAYPVVVMVYGSAWFSNNSKGSDINTIGSALLEAGYAVVTPNHRSSSDAIFPAQINDIKACIRFIRANCTEYQLDTSFIGITGSSSGGHLASLTGTTTNINKFTIDTLSCDMEGNVGNHLGTSSEVDAVCDWFGPTDFLIMDSCGSIMNHNAVNSPESSLIGGEIQKNKIKCYLANPVTYVDPEDPPFLIFHGDEDPLVPWCESVILHDALMSVGVDSEFILMPGGKHGPGVHTPSNFKKMVEFFNEVSKNNASCSLAAFKPAKTSRVVLNPTQYQIYYWGIPSKEISQSTVYDPLGNMISECQLNDEYIHISSLNSGLYFENIFSAEGYSSYGNFIKK